LPGLPFYATFETDQGEIEVLAETSTEGRTLRLTKIAVSPVATDYLEIGPKGVRQIVQEIEAFAANQGYNRVEFDGVRATGLRKGRQASAIRRVR